MKKILGRGVPMKKDSDAWNRFSYEKYLKYVYTYGKTLRTFLCLFILLCYPLLSKRWGTVMKNAKVSHD